MKILKSITSKEESPISILEWHLDGMHKNKKLKLEEDDDFFLK